MEIYAYTHIVMCDVYVKPLPQLDGDQDEGAINTGNLVTTPSLFEVGIQSPFTFHTCFRSRVQHRWNLLPFDFPASVISVIIFCICVELNPSHFSVFVEWHFKLLSFSSLYFTSCSLIDVRHV